MQNHITLITDTFEKEQINQTETEGNCGRQAEKNRSEAKLWKMLTTRLRNLDFCSQLLS